MSVFEELGNPFLEETTDILVLDTKEIASSSVAHSVQNVQKVGKEALESFVQERLIERKKPLSDALSRNSSSSAKAQRKDKQKVSSLKNDVQLFSHLYIISLDDFFSHENQRYPPSLSQEGKLRTGAKNDHLQCFKEMIRPTTQAPEVTCISLDGAGIVQMLNPGKAKTFGEYAKNVFIPFVLSQYKSATRLDLVWDRYLPGSLRNTTREAWKGRS